MRVFFSRKSKSPTVTLWNLVVGIRSGNGTHVYPVKLT